MATRAAPREIATLAHLTCNVYRCGYGVLFNELQRRGIGPAFVIDGVPHYDAAEVHPVYCDLLNAGRVPPLRFDIYVPMTRIEFIDSHRVPDKVRKAIKN